jgi:6-pyruvoyltetrahydropterin/6-carboxytetrahydropterin synthase
MRLTREVRFSPFDEQTETPVNNWSGPLVDHPGAPVQTLCISVRGRIDESTGYVCDIKQLDALARQVIVPPLRAVVRSSASTLADGARALRQGADAAVDCAPDGTRLEKVVWQLSPYLSFSLECEEKRMLLVTRSFEFAAAHRLACPGLSDEENRRLFGKCSNVHGHGHNYLVEVTVEATPDDDRAFAEAMAALDETVRRRVIEPFDHRNLNTECTEFATLNPTVENIARVIFDRLHDAFRGCRLHRVRVWETPKTCAEYAEHD